MMTAHLDSVVFDTPALGAMRAFYRDALGLSVGTYMKDGQEVPDESENYVNFDCGGIILGFERGDKAQTGTVVLMTKDFSESVKSLEAKGVGFKKRTEQFVIFSDPEGREIILQREGG